jgi:hypothetical protein
MAITRAVWDGRTRLAAARAAPGLPFAAAFTQFPS